MKNKTVYVVTRSGRRIEPENYSSQSEAQARASALVEMLREWDPGDIKKVSVVSSSKPHQIR